MKIGFLVFSVFLSLVCGQLYGDHNEGSFVTDAKLAELKTLSDSFTLKSGKVLADFDDPQVIPRDRDRRDFREDMDALASLIRTMERWIEEVKKNPGPQPQPNPQPEPQPVTPVKVEVSGYYAIGKDDTKDFGVAAAALQNECDAMQSTMQTLFPAAFYSFSCGKSANVSQFANIEYIQLASSPVVTIRLLSTARYDVVSDGYIAGRSDEKDPYKPWLSWWASCQTWMKAKQSAYPGRLIIASCGAPQNVSQYKNIGYKQFASTGSLYLAE